MEVKFTDHDNVTTEQCEYDQTNSITDQLTIDKANNNDTTDKSDDNNNSNQLKAKLRSSYNNNIALNAVTNDLSKTVKNMKSVKDAQIENQQIKDKQELNQLLSDTQSIIDNISKHENDPILMNTLKSNFENIQSTLSKSNDINSKITSKSSLFVNNNSTKSHLNSNSNSHFNFQSGSAMIDNENPTDSDIANLAQKRIENMSSSSINFNNKDEINKLSKPWMPNHQQCINRYFREASQEFATKLKCNTDEMMESQKDKIPTTKPSIHHSVRIPINETLSKSMNYTNLESNTNSKSNDNDTNINMDEIEKEINDIHDNMVPVSNKNKCFSPRRLREFSSPKRKHKDIEVVGLEIPLSQYYLKQSDYKQAKENLKNKINLRLTKKDINRIFQNDENKKMNIIEFNQRLSKLDKLQLNNVELKCLDEELTKINDNIDNDKVFDKEILTKYLQKPLSTKPMNVRHGPLLHLDSTLTLHHPFDVKLRSGTNSETMSNINSAPISPSKSNQRVPLIPIEKVEDYYSKYNQCIPFSDFVTGKGQGNSNDFDQNKKTENPKEIRKLHRQSQSPTADQLYKNMFNGFRKKHPQFEQWWIKQFYLKTKEHEIKSKVRRKRMIHDKHPTKSNVSLAQLPYNYKYQYRFSKKMAKRVNVDMAREHNLIKRDSAGLYHRCRSKHIRTHMWSPTRQRSFVCRK